MNLSSCGIDCDVCNFKTKQNCPGCSALEGKPHWTREEACDLYACAADKNLPHCGKCGEFPCAMLQEWASAENAERIKNLKKAGGNAMRTVFMTYLINTAANTQAKRMESGALVFKTDKKSSSRDKYLLF